MEVHQINLLLVELDLATLDRLQHLLGLMQLILSDVMILQETVHLLLDSFSLADLDVEVVQQLIIEHVLDYGLLGPQCLLQRHLLVSQILHILQMFHLQYIGIRINLLHELRDFREDELILVQYFPQSLLLHGLIEPFLVEVDVDILEQLCATLLQGMKKLHIICWSSNACTQRDHILHHLHGDVGHGA